MRILPSLVIILGLGGATAAHAQFVEPDVRVLQTLTGDTVGETFGWAIAQIEDIDSDGVTDLIVGAPGASDLAPFAGRAYVYSGASGRLLFKFEGEAGESLGWSEADAGDVDHDGVHDILVGAPSAGPGYVYIFSGRDGSLIEKVAGEHAGDYFGFAVGGIGDVDNDRRADFVVGAARASSVAPLQGRAYVYSGRHRTVLHTIDGEAAGDLFGSGIAGLGDVDRDRKGDFIVGARNAGPVGEGRAYVYSGATGRPIFQPFAPVASGVDFGWFFVASPGDVNGDGIPDIYVGDVDDSDPTLFSGRAYVYSGRDGKPLYQFPGMAGDGTGCGRGAGDVDGDRHADLIIGAYTSNEGAPFGGKATVYSGCNGSVLRTITSTTAGETLGYDAVGMGDLDGDREADFAISAASADRVYLVAGARTCIADFNKDGRIDVRDQLAILVALAHHDPRADTNCDGRIDLADYINFLGAILLGCG